MSPKLLKGKATLISYGRIRENWKPSETSYWLSVHDDLAFEKGSTQRLAIIYDDEKMPGYTLLKDNEIVENRTLDELFEHNQWFEVFEDWELTNFIAMIDVNFHLCGFTNVFIENKISLPEDRVNDNPASGFTFSESKVRVCEEMAEFLPNSLVIHTRHYDKSTLKIKTSGSYLSYFDELGRYWESNLLILQPNKKLISEECKNAIDGFGPESQETLCLAEYIRLWGTIEPQFLNILWNKLVTNWSPNYKYYEFADHLIIQMVQNIACDTDLYESILNKILDDIRNRKVSMSRSLFFAEAIIQPIYGAKGLLDGYRIGKIQKEYAYKILTEAAKYAPLEDLYRTPESSFIDVVDYLTNFSYVYDPAFAQELSKIYLERIDNDKVKKRTDSRISRKLQLNTKVHRNSYQRFGKSNVLLITFKRIQNTEKAKEIPPFTNDDFEKDQLTRLTIICSDKFFPNIWLINGEIIRCHTPKECEHNIQEIKELNNHEKNMLFNISNKLIKNDWQYFENTKTIYSQKNSDKIGIGETIKNDLDGALIVHYNHYNGSIRLDSTQPYKFNFEDIKSNNKLCAIIIQPTEKKIQESFVTFVLDEIKKNNNKLTPEKELDYSNFRALEEKATSLPFLQCILEWNSLDTDLLKSFWSKALQLLPAHPSPITYALAIKIAQEIAMDDQLAKKLSDELLAFIKDEKNDVVASALEFANEIVRHDIELTDHLHRFFIEITEYAQIDSLAIFERLIQVITRPTGLFDGYLAGKMVRIFIDKISNEQLKKKLEYKMKKILRFCELLNSTNIRF